LRNQIKAGVPPLLKYVALRQELVVGPGPLPPQLQVLLLDSQQAPRTCAETRHESKLHVVSLCDRDCLWRIYEQSHCVVMPDQELGVYAVVGRCRRQERKHNRTTQRGMDDEHDGDRWLAICPQLLAEHMAHQGFVFASNSPHPVSLATLQGRDLEGLSVLCPIAGQPKESVPIRADKKSVRVSDSIDQQATKTRQTTVRFLHPCGSWRTTL
jgi:hypothetical protein